MTKYLNISVDSTLGGNSPADNVVSSQKAIKDYVDAHSGGLPTQTGHAGEFLTTDGSVASWSDAVGYHPDLFAFQWADHELNNVQWLRADTFSWQSGAVYEAAYNHLVDDINEHEILYRWYDSHYDEECYTKTSTPTVGGNAYDANGQVIGTIEAYDSQYNTILVNAIEYARDSSGDIYSGFSTETVAGTTITYYLSADGHKIVLPDQESNVAAIYAATGAAWYYIIDTTNTRFKLPRINATKENIINSYQVITGAIHGNAGGTLKWMSDTSDNINGGAGTYIRINNASTETANMGNAQPTLSTNIRPNNLYADRDSSDSYFSGAKYLYFYVGSFTQTAIENTAGLNASLFNGKVDLDGSNATFPHIIESNTSGSVWYRKYSDGWVEQFGVATGTGSATATRCNLAIPMADGGYCITYGPTTNHMASVYLAAKTTTYFDIVTGNSGVGYYAVAFNWMVCGMAA